LAALLNARSFLAFGDRDLPSGCSADFDSATGAYCKITDMTSTFSQSRRKEDGSTRPSAKSHFWGLVAAGGICMSSRALPQTNTKVLATDPADRLMVNGVRQA
jgi:hypothetical protein